MLAAYGALSAAEKCVSLLRKRLLIFILLLTADHQGLKAQSTRRPIQASQACSGTTLVLSCPRGEVVRIWQYGYVPPEIDCSRQLDYNFEIGKDSVNYYSNRFVSVARNAEPNLHSLVRKCNGRQRCKTVVKILHPSATKSNATNYIDNEAMNYAQPTVAASASGFSFNSFSTFRQRKPGIRVLFSCELVQNYGIPSVRSICDRFEFITSGRFHIRSPGYPASAHKFGALKQRGKVPTKCSCELRSKFGFNLVVVEMELGNGTRSGYKPYDTAPPTTRDWNNCPSVMRFWNASGHVGILPCVFEPKLRINWHDVIKQTRMGMSLEFSVSEEFANDMTRFWFEIQPRRSYTCPVFGCSLHECSGDADCHSPDHSCCCDKTVGLRVCKAFSPYDQLEQGILNISCNKMVYSENDPPPNLPTISPPIIDVNEDTSAVGNESFIYADGQNKPGNDILLGVVIGCAMFFAFMLLGASVFFYCYCRAQRSAGNLGVRPRLSKIGDHWAISTANNMPSANRGASEFNKKIAAKRSNTRSGGFIVKSEEGNNEPLAVPPARSVSQTQKDTTTPSSGMGAKRMSFDGDSSFVDFDRDNSREQSAESRHVAGECLLKIPEDRVRLLNNSSVVSELPVLEALAGSNDASTEPPHQVAAQDEKNQLIEICSTTYTAQSVLAENASDPESEVVALPLVATCIVDNVSVDVKGNSADRQLNVTAVIQSQEGYDTPGSPPTSTLTDTLMAAKISDSPSASSQMSGSISPPTSSVIYYETLLINPPMSLANSKHNLPQPPPPLPSTPQQLPKYATEPHKRFILPGMPPKRDKPTIGPADKKPPLIATISKDSNETKSTNDESKDGAASPSKDSLSSVSGIIKLDIISAF